MRDYKLYIHDIAESINNIEKYTKGYTFDDFDIDQKTNEGLLNL
ncbi:hypothetical protein ACFL2K_04015 [Candidatus Margulisiibacteriota bacterium]